jgi:hypothetical protein
MIGISDWETVALHDELGYYTCFLWNGLRKLMKMLVGEHVYTAGIELENS